VERAVVSCVPVHAPRRSTAAERQATLTLPIYRRILGTPRSDVDRTTFARVRFGLSAWHPWADVVRGGHDSDRHLGPFQQGTDLCSGDRAETTWPTGRASIESGAAGETMAASARTITPEATPSRGARDRRRGGRPHRPSPERREGAPVHPPQ
jgi:hypothetical protein